MLFQTIHRCWRIEVRAPPIGGANLGDCAESSFGTRPIACTCGVSVGFSTKSRTWREGAQIFRKFGSQCIRRAVEDPSGRIYTPVFLFFFFFGPLFVG